MRQEDEESWVMALGYIIKTLVMGFQRLLIIQHWLLFQRSLVGSLTPTAGGSPLPVAPVPEALTPSCGLHGHLRVCDSIQMSRRM